MFAIVVLLIGAGVGLAIVAAAIALLLAELVALFLRRRSE